MKSLMTFVSLFLLGILSVSAQAATCVVGSATTTPSLTISFTAPTKNVDGTAIALPLTYNVYGATTAGGEVKGLTGLTGSPISINQSLTPGSTYYIKISVTDANGKESALSNEVCKTFPATAPKSTPATVTITIS